MDQVRWARIEALCEAALEQPSGEREGWLAAACGDDALLLAEVTSLLEQLRADPDFLERPAVDLGRASLAAPGGGTLPTAIDRWQIVRRLGRGGMGEVFLGECNGDQVAIKVLRDDIDSAEIVRRFALEQRILATLQHPNIARLLEATLTADGRPCVVLEYVAGVPITAHADLRRLSLRDRMALVIAVCGAVEHAHRSLVVHRDIKPANILVTDDGTPVLLDFGIGKVLDRTGMMGSVIETSGTDRLLTLDYAAPEQLRGEVVTTATDVHALGVLLHELLTGLHPFRHVGSTPGQVEHAILEQEPDRPSAVVRVAPASGPVAEGDARARAEARGFGSAEALGRRLGGDIDNIVLMALRKEPERRYPSVAALAEDLRRHLGGRPVRARPDTLGYRARKFVRRNAGSVATATLAVLALLATTGAALRASRRATHNAAATEAERDEAVAVRGFLMEMFGATGGGQRVGQSETVRQLLDRQAARIDSAHGDDPLLAARLDEVVADAYDRLGLPDQAVPLAERALALRRANQPESDPRVTGAENLLGWVLHQSGHGDEAESHLRVAATLARTHGDSGALAHALNDLGVLYNAAGRYAEADSTLTEALALRRAVDGDGNLGVGITANNLAAAFYYQARYGEAVATQQVALGALRASVGKDHQRTVIARSNLAAFRMADGDFISAERDYRELLAQQTRLQGPEHPVTRRVVLALTAALIGRQDAGRPEALREADSLLTALMAIEERTNATPADRGSTFDRLAGVRLARDDATSALDLARRAVATLTLAHGPRHPDVASASGRLALIEARLGDTQSAMRHAREGLATLVDRLGSDHPETARGRGRLCRVMVAVGSDSANAADTCAAAMAGLENAPAGYRGELAEVRRVSGRRGG